VSTAVTAGLTASLLGGAVIGTPSQAQAQATPNKSSSTPSAPVASRPDSVSAMMAAKKQGSRVEVLDDRTDASQTFANPDGTFSYQAYAVPQWTEQSGSWKTLDPTLTTTASGSVVPTLSQSPLVLSSGGSGPLATMTVDGKQFSVTWPTALPKPTLSGATATYDNVLPSGVNLQVTATAAGGVEETLIVENATAAADPALASLVQATSGSTGTTVSADAGGNLTVTDASGNALVTSPAPVMWDSSTSATATGTTPDSPSPAASPSASAMTGGANAAGADKVKVASLDETPATRSGVSGPGSRAHQGRVKVTYSKHKLDLAPDHGLLTAKSTTFPVYIDPAYVPHPATGTTLDWDEVQSAYPTTSEYNAAPGSGLGVGYQGFSSPTGIERSYYALSIPSAIYGATILSASLNTTVTYAAASGSNSDTVDAYSTSAISSTTTWNTQPGHESGANANYPNPDATATFTTTSQSPNKAVAFNLLSSMQLIATAHNYKTWDFELANSTETNDVDLVRFADNPTFSITYNTPPATPASLSMTPSSTVGSTAYSSTGTPVLSSSATDADGDTVQLDYQILSGTTVKASGTSSGFVNSGTPATWKPTTALANGAYTWQVRAYDGNAYSAWTTAQAFTVDTTTPPAPTITCTGYPVGVWTAAISGGTTCTLSDTSADVSSFTWGLDSGAGTWISGSGTKSITINPAPGYHSIYASVASDANTGSADSYYVFGVGSAGITSPADQSTTSTTLPLSATAPSGATTVTFKYRVGTTGSFTSIPTADVTNNGAALTWPLATTAGTGVVTTPTLTWNLAQTVSDDGLLQVEAEFSAANGNVVDSPPVSVTLDRLGTGVDFGTTQTGPVTVGLQSGNASVTADDVNISSFGSELGVLRTFNSLSPKGSGIFGPGWAATLPVSGAGDSWSSVTDEGSYAQLTGEDGSVLTFATGATTSGVTSYTAQGPAATSGLTLVKNSTGFLLTDGSSNQISFTLPAGGTAGVYLPTTVTQPSSASSTGFVFDGKSGDTTYGQVMLAVAPDAASSQPSTTACPYPASASTWGAGCRGLEFTYDSTGKLLTEVDFVTSDGTTLTKTAVAQYSYDSTGRLAAAWDPRISPALKTTYTYDETSTDPDFGRLTQISPAQQSGSNALAPWNLSYNDTANSADFGKLVAVSRSHNAANGGGTAVNQVIYSVPLTTAAGGPTNMDPATVATWGQTDEPVSAVAVFPANHAPGSGTITDWTYAQIDYYDAQGREVNTASYNNGWNVATTEYDQYGNDVRELTADNRATALAAGATSATVAAQLDTRNIYSTDGTELLDTYGPAHQATAAGTLQTIRTHTHNVYDQGAPNNDVDADGAPYGLVTSATISASLGSDAPGNTDVDGRTTQYVYNNGSDNEGWTLGTPLQTITDPGTGHLNITSTVAYNENSSLYGGDALQISSSQPSDTTGTGAGTTRTIYYTAGANSADSSCGNQPVWADLVCKTEPAAQPGTTGLAGLPVTQYTYNVYLDPLTVTQTYTAADGTTSTGTTTTSYDNAERPTNSTVTTTGTGMGTAVPPTASVYSPVTGFQTDTETLSPTGTETADLYSTYDDWGQPSSYTDASGSVTYFTYDLAGDLISRSDSGDTSTLTYNSDTDHSGDMTSMADKSAGTFGATYDADGNLTSESYPGSTTGTYTYDATGTATNLVYKNSSWVGTLTDSISTNAYGDWTNRTVLDDQQNYTYDNDDRLTNVADTQNGQCTTRSYGFDADSNRTAATTASPAADGSCQTADSTTATSTYDAADRLTNPGYTYDTQGNTTTTPSVDAEGNGDLTATYFVDDMVASQSQGSATMTFQYDPTGDRVSNYTDESGTTYTDHYADNSDDPVWVTGSDGSSSRDVQGPTGLVAEIDSNGNTTLQLVNLHGDIMASVDPVADNVTATSSYTEFGEAETGTSSTYGWLGSSQRSHAVAGQILMGDRVYNPQTGRFSQTDPLSGGSANAYDYGNQNPVTQFDPTGDSAEGFTGFECVGVKEVFGIPLRECNCAFEHEVTGSGRHISHENADVVCALPHESICDYRIDFYYTHTTSHGTSGAPTYRTTYGATHYACFYGNWSGRYAPGNLTLPYYGQACARLVSNDKVLATQCINIE